VVDPVTRPRFVKATPAAGELSRWTVQVGLHSPGVVVSKRWGQASAYWLAYPDADPAKVIRYDGRAGPGLRGGKPRVFLSRREAGDALLLAAEAALGQSRARHPSEGGP
jgi:hypothetical protein